MSGNSWWVQKADMVFSVRLAFACERIRPITRKAGDERKFLVGAYKKSSAATEDFLKFN
jgi:hypothetical protein